MVGGGPQQLLNKQIIIIKTNPYANFLTINCPLIDKYSMAALVNRTISLEVAKNWLFYLKKLQVLYKVRKEEIRPIMNIRLVASGTAKCFF